MHDFTVLEQRLSNNIAEFKRLGMTVEHTELLGHLQHAHASLTEFIGEGRLAAGGRKLPAVATPFFLPRRHLETPKQQSCETEAACTSVTSTRLRLATF